MRRVITAFAFSVSLAVLSHNGKLLAEPVPHSIAGVRVADIANGDKFLKKKVFLKASKERVFAYMVDFEKMPEWMSSVKSVAVDNRRSRNGVNQVGVGTVRSCKMTGAACQEVVVHYNAPHSFAYKMTSSSGIAMPFAEGTGVILLEDSPRGGTVMTFSVIYKNKMLHPAAMMSGMMLEKQLGDGLDKIARQFGGHRLE